MYFHSALHFVSVDPSIGKIDKHSLSQQTLMELLIEGFENKEEIVGSSDEPKDISEWFRVEFNNDKGVRLIHWSFMRIGGSIELKWLPFTLQELYLQKALLTGTADLTCLPNGLSSLSLSHNQFEGSISLTQLPSGLTKLFLYENAFCGHTDFSNLPKSLTVLDVSNTDLEGEVFDFDGRLVTEGSKVKFGN